MESNRRNLQTAAEQYEAAKRLQEEAVIKAKIEHELAKKRFEDELRIQKVLADQRAADALERQVWEQRRIADKLDDIDWDLRRSRR